MIIGKYPSLRLRRSRKESWSRRLIQENTLSPNDFILPIFLIEGTNKRQAISSMPGVYRFTINIMSLDLLISVMEHEQVQNVYFTPSSPATGQGMDSISMIYKVYVKYHPVEE